MLSPRPRLQALALVCLCLLCPTGLAVTLPPGHDGGDDPGPLASLDLPPAARTAPGVSEADCEALADRMADLVARDKPRAARRHGPTSRRPAATDAQTPALGEFLNGQTDGAPAEPLLAAMRGLETPFRHLPALVSTNFSYTVQEWLRESAAWGQAPTASASDLGSEASPKTASAEPGGAEEGEAQAPATRGPAVELSDGMLWCGVVLAAAILFGGVAARAVWRCDRLEDEV